MEENELEQICACDLCDYKANHGNALNKHKMVVHKVVKEYICDLCNFRSGHPSALKRHKENLHDKTNQITYHCDICEYKTNYKHALKRHTANKHNKDSLVSYKCSFCDYVSTYDFIMERHITTMHIKEGEHSCTKCDYTTVHKQSLDRHVRIVHERPMRYSCGECDFKSGHSSALRMHTATVHQSRKAFHCDICGFETLYKTALMRHSKTVNCSGKYKGVGAGNLLKQENEEKKEKGISQDIIHIDPSSVSSADYSRVEISKQLIDPLAGTHAYSVVLNKDFVLQAPSHETLPTKPLVINTSSVNFPKSEDGFSTSLVFNTNPALSSITLIEKDGLLYQVTDKYRSGDIIQVAVSSQEDILRIGSG